MFFLFLLLPFWGLEVLIPVVLWFAAAPRWHPLLACMYGVLAAILLGIWVRAVLRSRAENRLIPSTHATWQWSKQATAETFQIQIEMFLRMHGWRTTALPVCQTGRVALRAQKDRTIVALLCVGPRHQPGPQDLAEIARFRRSSLQPLVALVSNAKLDAATVRAAADAGVIRLRFSDLRRLEQVVGGWEV
jgi:hypothetical protein